MNAELIMKLDDLSLARGDHREFFFEILDLDERVTSWLTNVGFFTDPASARYHGAWSYGLAQHSLRVLHHVLRLFESFCPETDRQSMLYGTILHDICKAGSYEISTRNVKKNGQWTTEPFYMNKAQVTIGHGVESCRRIEKLGIQLTEGWYQAVRWHMGAYDATDTDKYGMMEATKTYPEVLLLQTADILAGIRDNI